MLLLLLLLALHHEKVSHLFYFLFILTSSLILLFLLMLLLFLFLRKRRGRSNRANIKGYTPSNAARFMHTDTEGSDYYLPMLRLFQIPKVEILPAIGGYRLAGIEGY